MRAIILTKAHQYDGQGVNCDLSTASEVFLIFTAKLYSYLCNYNAMVFIY